MVPGQVTLIQLGFRRNYQLEGMYTISHFALFSFRFKLNYLIGSQGVSEELTNADSSLTAEPTVVSNR